jgi:hypothetical protein
VVQARLGNIAIGLTIATLSGQAAFAQEADLVLLKPQVFLAENYSGVYGVFTKVYGLSGEVRYVAYSNGPGITYRFEFRNNYDKPNYYDRTTHFLYYDSKEDKPVHQMITELMDLSKTGQLETATVRCKNELNPFRVTEHKDGYKEIYTMSTINSSNCILANVIGKRFNSK